MQVSQLMNSTVISVGTDASVEEAAQLLAHYDIGALPVVTRGGKLRGIVTDRDIVLRAVAGEDGAQRTTVGDIMTRNVYSITPEAGVDEAAGIMAEKRIRRLPVAKDGTLLGILSLADIARSRLYDTEASAALSEISAPGRKNPR